MIRDGESASGSINTVERIGDTIRRPTHRWTPAVHALLLHRRVVRATNAATAMVSAEVRAQQDSDLHGQMAGQTAMA